MYRRFVFGKRCLDPLYLSLMDLDKMFERLNAVDAREELKPADEVGYVMPSSR